MRLTVVVPTLNEASHLAAALESAPGEAEVVVSDGGSTDETVAIAERSRARVVTGSRGRARQMNRGAEIASGDVLVFLHADCTLGPSTLDRIERALVDGAVVGGSFRLAIRNASRGLRIIAATSNARARYLRAPYGDQAIFVRRHAFDELGGFPDVPFMEDVAFVRELKRLGKLVVVDENVTTDARHWRHLGPVATTLLNWAMVSLFLLGVSPERLAPLYRRLRCRGAATGSEKALSSS